MSLFLSRYGERPIKYFSASVGAAATDTELVAAAVGRKIRVLSLAATHDGAVGPTSNASYLVESGTTVRKHAFNLPLAGPHVLPFNEGGWFETASGASLTITTPAGGEIEISGSYVEV